MNRYGGRDRDRRRDARVTAMGLRARVRFGQCVVVIDQSARGVLVEALRPLRPGAHVDVQLETDARCESVTALVVRCAVAAIDSQSGVTYRAALSFSKSCEWVREALTQAGHGLPALAGDGTAISAGSGEWLPAAHHANASAQTKGTK